MTPLTQGGFLLPLILGLPLLGAIFVMCTPKGESSLHRGIGLFFSIAAFLVALAVFPSSNPKVAGSRLVFGAEWIPGLNAPFKRGVETGNPLGVEHQLEAGLFRVVERGRLPAGVRHRVDS